MTIWVVLYTEYTDSDQVLGAFESEEAAKYFIGDYSLKNEVYSGSLHVVKTKVEVNE